MTSSSGLVRGDPYLYGTSRSPPVSKVRDPLENVTMDSTALSNETRKLNEKYELVWGFL